MARKPHRMPWNASAYARTSDYFRPFEAFLAPPPQAKGVAL